MVWVKDDSNRSLFRIHAIYPTSNKKSKIALECFLNDLMLRYGMPSKTLYDQG